MQSGTSIKDGGDIQQDHQPTLSDMLPSDQYTTTVLAKTLKRKEEVDVLSSVERTKSPKLKPSQESDQTSSGMW